MRTLIVSLFAGAAIVSTQACDGEAPQEVECPEQRGPFTLGEGRVTGTLELDVGAKPLSAGDVLVVRGSAHHEDGLAIREVRIAGVGATRDAFNFQAFSAELPYQKVVASAEPDARGQVTLEASAIDACGNRYPFAVAMVDVDPTPGIAVDQLELSVVYPGERGFIPADGTTPAIVSVIATGRAVGAVVRIQASSGTLGNVDARGDVTLSAPAGTTDSASASVLVYGTTPGTITLTAVVENQLAATLVEVAGPPKLSPALATLVAGESLEVTIDGASAVQCRAESDDDLIVASNETPLDGELVAVEGALRVRAVAEPVGSGTTVVVSCEDVYKQSASGRYTLTVAPADETPEEPDVPEDP